MSKLLCFGGSFDPIHHGHLICARAVAESRDFGGVLLIPNARPPHKDSREMAPADDRLAMCRVAVASDPFFHVSDIEILGEGPGYTLHTARELARRGWPKVSWLIGGDALSQLPTWHQAAVLIDEVNILIMGRPGWEFNWENLPPVFQKLRENVIAGPRIDISSTDIRRRTRAGLPIQYLSPEPVVDYIVQQGLYRGA